MHRLLAALALLVAVVLPARASADVEIKLGTLAPKGSLWDVLMREMAQKWSEASGGKVKLRIYPGGVLGNEGDMVRKMRVGQLNAAALTMVGLHDITPEPQAVDAPMLIQSYEELDYVMSKMAPALEKIIEAKGYEMLAWSEVGFVYFFSARTFRTPAEAKDVKLFAWDGDPESVEAMKATGLHPVVLSSTDIVPSLQTGLIDTVATAPLYALTARLYQKANRMIDLPWAILNGGTIVRKDTWDKVPPELRARLLEIARSYARRITLEVRRMNEEALATMKAQGLQVIQPGELAAWRKAADNANLVVRGRVVPAAVFDEVVRYHNEFRSRR